MRLTNNLRDSFISSVMRDLPHKTKNYQDDIRALAFKDAESKLPPEILAIWKNPKLKGHIATSHFSMPDYYFGGTESIDYNYRVNFIYIPGASGNFKLSDAAHKKIDAIYRAAIPEAKQRKELETRLRAVAYGASNTKMLAEMLPEFAAYIPEDEVANRTLPVVVDVVSDFVKAGLKLKKPAKKASNTAVAVV